MTGALVAIAGPRLVALAAACAGCAPRAPAPRPTAPQATLTKAELRPVLKAVVPALAACVGDGAAAGVVELALTITSDAHGTAIAVDDVLVTGPLAAAPGFRGCAAAALAAAPAPRLARAGRAAIRYPVTFDPRPPDNRDAALVDAAAQAAAAGRWREARTQAEAGLTRTSLDGPHRRRLIELAGVAACALGDRAAAARYQALAAPAAEAVIAAACAR
ncbi:MAG: hypothetical protein JNK64_23870 [Myxococcales bacterium]|nr:hypothetical protein [Myxococcales bacterium]